MSTTYEVGPGARVEDVAQAMVELARSSGETVTAEFNGTPIVARPHVSAAHAVLNEWHYERLIFLLKRGVIRVEDLP